VIGRSARNENVVAPYFVQSNPTYGALIGDAARRSRFAELVMSAFRLHQQTTPPKNEIHADPDHRIQPKLL